VSWSGPRHPWDVGQSAEGIATSFRTWTENHLHSFITTGFQPHTQQQLPEACPYSNRVDAEAFALRALRATSWTTTPDGSPAQQSSRGTPTRPPAPNWGVTVHTVTQTEGSVPVVERSTTHVERRSSFSSTCRQLQQWCQRQRVPFSCPSCNFVEKTPDGSTTLPV